MKSGEESLADEFWKVNSYVAGAYDTKRDFEMLNQEMSNLEEKISRVRNRLYYLALPPSVFASVTSLIKGFCYITWILRQIVQHICKVMNSTILKYQKLFVSQR